MCYDKTYESFLEAFPNATQDIFKEPRTCCICGEDYYGCGNDAAPLVDGSCCDQCNTDYVFPARFAYREMAEDPTLRKVMNDCCDGYGIISDKMSSEEKVVHYVLAYNKEQFPCLESFPESGSNFFRRLQIEHIGDLLMQDCMETGYGVLLLEDNNIRVLFNNEKPYQWLLFRAQNRVDIGKAA